MQLLLPLGSRVGFVVRRRFAVDDKRAPTLCPAYFGWQQLYYYLLFILTGSRTASTTDVPYFKKLEFPPVSIFHTLNAAHRGFGVTLSSIRNIVYLIHHAHCRHPDYFFAMNMSCVLQSPEFSIIH